MILVCNDRDAAHKRSRHSTTTRIPCRWSGLRDCMARGTLRETLLASEEWQTVNERFSHWRDRPEFHLDA